MRSSTGIMFVAATCIGSGMIALPITLAKIGIIPSIIVMLSIWFIIYYTAVVNLELNLQLGKGMALGPLCRHFSGKKIEIIGTLLLKILSYSLLCAYIAGGSSLLGKILGIENLTLWFSASLFWIFYLPPSFIKQINNILFIGLLGVTAILIGFLTSSINWSQVPLFEKSDWSVWSVLIPVVFTSFGFQVIFHTLTDYYKGHAIKLKRVFFWGSLIPAVVYIIWTSSVIGALHSNSHFYQKMVSGLVNESELVLQLSLIAENEFVQKLVMWLSLLAIITSAIGVGLGLVGSITNAIKEKIPQIQDRQLRTLSPVLSVFPAHFIVLLIPNAFVSILGFAGMILSGVAIILPIYLLTLVKKDFYYPELKNKFLINLSLVVGIVIIICKIVNIF